MHAFMCDSCKQFYKGNVNDIKYVIKTPVGYLDLCDNCHKKLENFIKEGEFK